MRSSMGNETVWDLSQLSEPHQPMLASTSSEASKFA
jgi:hypothetical protein